MCARINPGEELEYYTGCYIDGSPFYYQTLQPGEIYEMRYIVSMVRLMSDPYGTAYKLSDDNVHFFDLLADTTTISIIKWIFFLSAVSLFFVWLESCCLLCSFSVLLYWVCQMRMRLLSRISSREEWVWLLWDNEVFLVLGIVIFVFEINFPIVLIF